MSNSQVAIPLSKRDKMLVVVGSCIFMFFMAGNGTALAISQKFLLEKFGGLEYFSIATILISLGTTIMTPIGGALGIIFGRRNLMVVSGLVAFITTVAVVYATNIYVYLFLIIANGLAKGAFTATPYILMSLINERKDIPKSMGLLASSVSAGTLVASLLSGVFNDMGQTELGIILTSATVLIGIVFIYMGLPNAKSEVKVKLDLVGMTLLTITMSAFVLAFNFGSSLGWLSPQILAGFAVLVVFGILLVNYEAKVEKAGGTPVITTSLFKNKEYVAILIVGVTLYFYQVVMMNYGTLAAMDILGANATVASTLTIPRTIVTLVLPTLVGAWVSKKKSNSWLAIAIGSFLLLVSFAPLLFISNTMSIVVFFVAFTITGISESFRAVSVLPAAQETLDEAQIATGTSTVSFVNTLAPVLSATFSGAIFNAANGDTVLGFRNIVIGTLIVSAIGLVIVMLVIRPAQMKRYKNN